MAAALTDTATAISGDVVVARRRGKSKCPNFSYEGPVSVIGLQPDACDARTRRRVGRQWEAVFGHCLCGQRVPKPLAQRTHHCPHCGLRADRDATSTILAACVELTDPDDPRTARVDFELAHALRAGLASQQEWEGSVNRHQPPAAPVAESARTGSHHPVASAERAALGPPPNRPGTPGRHGPSRKQPAPKLIGAA